MRHSYVLTVFSPTAPLAAPKNVKVDRTSGTEMVVSWTPPTLKEARGFIDHYVVYYTDGEKEEEVTCDASPCKITGLDATTTYSVSVSAVNGADEDPEGPTSAPVKGECV